ncbi:hypothetical protein GCM10011348_44980 [Marinobacterium nitratireducens]|uniref:DM13 domain-containing protein n=1 Tax=Marinobacterium nitratireducens TaxID=518897 RepID=A0A917ZPG1_9GAMM|nr:DM13 domain-containing protein [Marinobacterium nitratireducens]GGO88765.1 hypothetical protein GCM10011348_44980 [Marinobacterium nitratireducens]
MKNLIIGLLLGAMLGVTAGFALGIVAFPYLFPPAPVNEQLTGLVTGARVAAGRFIHADPKDPLHHGRGGVQVYQNLVHLESDFEVGPGPKYHLYLVPDADVGPDTAVDETMFVDLGRLKAFSGSQNYPVPPGTDLADYGSVVVWCEQFGVLISPARLVADTPP